ncbi:COQ9 family protein [Xinfangfangia sp. D13-10-4-6]|uniref:COQ9 family protein n=1 Tax=Pseudogemmobacter hezensis TaxID=2737662 RepID=UPI001555AA2C|nr:COQ9 family protein [Pseudogemmobacter hezensis]NPD16601.1 COQ9 family protein [Pseudogemmobacter hezensis]
MEAAITREKLLDAALSHVAFDGWSEATLKAAAADSGVDPGLAQALFPRGGVDLALAWHQAGDREMVRRLGEEDLSALRFRDRVARAVMLRLELADREAVRRGTTLFALPQHAADGAGAIWSSADAIWTALGDTSDDVNWYTKRATLSAVYGATVLFWLGDDSPDLQATRDFLDRRIEGVMWFEKTKAALAKNPLGKALMSGPLGFLARIRPPHRPAGLPGHESGASETKAPRPF